MRSLGSGGCDDSDLVGISLSCKSRYSDDSITVRLLDRSRFLLFVLLPVSVMSWEERPKRIKLSLHYLYTRILKMRKESTSAGTIGR